MSFPLAASFFATYGTAHGTAEKGQTTQVWAARGNGAFAHTAPIPSPTAFILAASTAASFTAARTSQGKALGTASIRRLLRDAGTAAFPGRMSAVAKATTAAISSTNLICRTPATVLDGCTQAYTNVGTIKEANILKKVLLGKSVPM